MARPAGAGEGAVSEAQLPPFAEGIFTGEGATTRLLGSRCGDGRMLFPRTALCPDDGRATDPIELPTRATLYSFTVVRLKPPFGLPAPYAVGYVDLVGVDLRLFMLLDPAATDKLRIGMTLAPSSGPLGVGLDGAPCIRPYFTPEGAA